MLIWQGKGILAVLPFLVLFLPTMIILDEGAGLEANIAVGTGFVLAGVLGAAGIWWFDRWLERRNPPRVLVDQQTGQQVVYKRRDTLFFIPLRFFPYAYGLLCVVGVVAFVTG
jgi:protein-S-isoprenylcysteine O-methyltransferase Ste14